MTIVLSQDATFSGDFVTFTRNDRRQKELKRVVRVPLTFLNGKTETRLNDNDQLHDLVWLVVDFSRHSLNEM